MHLMAKFIPLLLAVVLGRCASARMALAGASLSAGGLAIPD